MFLGSEKKKTNFGESVIRGNGDCLYGQGEVRSFYLDSWAFKVDFNR